MNAFTLVALLAAFVAQSSAKTHYGWATAYSGPYKMDETGQNMCEFNPRKMKRKWQVYYGAMNEADWNEVGGIKGISGMCVRAPGTKGQVTRGHYIKPIIVKIVDQCPSWACNKGSVDFSTTALKAITGYGWDKKKIVWEWVHCHNGRPKRKSHNGRSLV